MFDEPALTITHISPRSVAGIGGLRDRAGLLAALGVEFGVPVPTAPKCVQAGPITLSCLAPSRYMAGGPRDANLPARLSLSLAGIAAITDQSDIWETFAVSCARARDLLARIVPVDMDSERFRIGDLALTRGGHLDLRLCRVADTSYEISVARSYANDLRYLLDLGKQGLLS